MFNLDDTPAYAGQTSNLRSGLRQHLVRQDSSVSSYDRLDPWDIETRPHDIVATDTGDTNIIDGCAEYYADNPTGVILFSNDYGFVDQARERKVPAVHVDFSVDFPRRLTGT